MISVQCLNLPLQECLRLLLLMSLAPERFLKFHNLLQHNAVRGLVLNQRLPVKPVHIRFYQVQLPFRLLQPLSVILQIVLESE